MKIEYFTPTKMVFVFLIVWGVNGHGQHGASSKSKFYTIAYGSKQTGNIEIYSGHKTGTSKIKSTHQNGGYAAWSPNGKRIAFYAKYDDKKTWSIHTMNSDGSHRKRLTYTKNTWDSAPDWSPDGKKIVFAREYTDAAGVRHPEIWMMNADGSNQTQIKSLKGTNPYFTPNGKRLVFSWEFEDKRSAISISDLNGKNITRLTHHDGEEWHPEVSPDGKHIAFMSNRDGNFEIYVMDIDGSHQKRLTHSAIGDWYPSWSPDGSQIIFSNPTGKNKKDRTIYVMNADGTAKRKLIDHGSQAEWLKTIQY